MFKKAIGFSERLAAQAGWIPTISGYGVVTIVGALSARFTQQTAWLQSYGAAAWWFGGLFGALMAALVFVAAAHIRLTIIKGSAIQKWKQTVDTINPLDGEFVRRRIRMSDLASPVTRSIMKKRFVDCELIGPANVAMLDHVHMTGTHFGNCDVVVIKPKGAIVYNAIRMLHVEVLGGSITECTLYIPVNLVDTFVAMGASFISLTGNEAMDSSVSLGGRSRGSPDQYPQAPMPPPPPA